MRNNRKTAAFITALAMIITAVKINIGTAAIKAENEIIYGDLNSDGKVDVSDLSLLSLYLIGDKDLDSDELKEAADTEYDHVVNLGDLARLRMYLSKKTDIIGKKTEPVISGEQTDDAGKSELKDITDQCVFLEIDNYYNNADCAIYSKFIEKYTENLTVMISTKEDYDRYIGCYEGAVNAFEKAGITVGDDFFDNKRIAIEMNNQEVNGVQMDLTAVRTDEHGNVDLYFDRIIPGTMTCLGSYYYNIVIVPDNPHNDSSAASHYNNKT